MSSEKKAGRGLAALAVLLALTAALAGCAQKTAEWVPADWADSGVFLAAFTYRGGEPEKVTLKLRTMEKTLRTVEWKASEGKASTGDAYQADEVEEKRLPCTASELEPLTEACARWMKDNEPESGSYDLTVYAADGKTLDADLDGMMQKDSVKLVYSVGAETLRELPETLDRQSVQGTGNILVQEANGTRTIDLLITK